ncbi:AfsR/SARP family transcriptional regulator [Streptomyces sp. H27-D2]|uniref:AfsR/SARP family transcriptional regulator n=1 Tax=Streptomyces sp. H27-D2 TaxID=3046304 RepID=UPI002DBC4679|nr:AfsR/SARP family transcriptional regulator [Streptomyces sp. H27-D2]MEC4016285.1 AfsR/SARP family transcriptional regulator [Streptomyces sp. H27-D2]
MKDRINISVLGPVVAATAREPLAICGDRQRRTLASLALSRGQIVPIDRLIHDAWGDRPPRTVGAQLQTSIWMLRRALAAAGAPQSAVVSYASGYQLDRPAFVVDVDEFRHSVGNARELHRRDRPEDALRALNDALALWPGPALADADSPALRARAARLEEERLAALEQRITLDIELCHYEQAIGELLDLVPQHPFREGLYADLMLALYWTGRQSEALAVFRDARATLAGELGIAPGPRLSALEQAVLRQDGETLRRSGGLARAR